MAALKAIVTRYTAQSVMRICMLPRELIWERVAPYHTGVTQNSGWPSLQLLWSAPKKAQSLMWCAISNVVSLSLSLSLALPMIRRLNLISTGVILWRGHQMGEIQTLTGWYALADLGGACPAHAPLPPMVQILLFRHTRVQAPPYRKSWIHHWYELKYGHKYGFWYHTWW